VYFADCFAGEFDPRFWPGRSRGGKDLRVLDLGCGVGFWAVEFGLAGYTDIVACDLTKNAIAITAKRAETHGLKLKLSQQNAEQLDFENNSFDHVNCQGVIHHTPDTDACLREIARVLRPGGTASISVYHRNVFLKSWPILRWVGLALHHLGAGLKGRGRDSIYSEGNPDEIVRLYDGVNNPIGKSYTKRQFISMAKDYFEIEETYLHFFPARSLPFKVPKKIHRFLDRHVGFMLYASLRVPE
jgi:ubiquinone/menaquinone biosynthesis C-methylase UbiE